MRFLLLLRRALAEWRLRATARRELWSLDAYMLRDLGLSHHAAAELNLNPRELP
jgi:uncharacterized protein YjiS (DUF1127 family)